MAFELPALPNFQTNIAQPPSVLDQYSKMLQLKALSGQQQLLPLEVQEKQQQVQGAQLQNQRTQMDIDSQKALVKAWSNPKFLDSFTGTDAAKANGLGFDPDAMTKSLIEQGVLPKDAFAQSQMFIERSQKIAETLKAQSQTGEAEANMREKGYKQLADRVGGILDMPAAKATDGLAQLKQDLIKNPQAFSGVPHEDLAHIYSADLEHLPAMATLIGLDAKLADFHKSKAEAASAQYKQGQEQVAAAGGLTDESKQKIAVETNPQVQAGKEKVAEAEAYAHERIAGLVKPVYAYDPNSKQTVLTNQTDAQTKGLQGMRPVTEKEISGDVQINNRLADVAQKIARYEGTVSEPLSKSDTQKIAAVLGDDKFKAGLLGTELPVDWLNKLAKARDVSDLSPAAQKRLVAYYNAREAMQGYTRVLTGSARSSETAMQLNLDALPSPLVAPDFAAESLGQFKENIGIAAQGLPTLPGIKSPADIVKNFQQSKPSSAKQVPQIGTIEDGYRFKGGDPSKRESWEKAN